MKCGDPKRCLQLVAAIGLTFSAVSLVVPEAEAAVCYDQYGRRHVVDPYTLSANYNCYNTAGVVVVIRPLGAAYVGGYYGAAGVRGTARRTSRRTSRRVGRRR